MKNIIILAALSLATVQCTTMGPSTTTTSVVKKELQREWMLTQLGKHTKEELTKAKAKLSFTDLGTPKAQVKAYAGCNQMFGDAKFTGANGVSFPALASTMMYCDGLMDLEAEYAKALKEVTRYEVKGHQLTLYKGNDVKAVYIAADWD